MSGFQPLTAITYPQLLSQRKYVFGIAEDNGHLIVFYTLDDGINWSWVDQNQNPTLPKGVSSVSSPTAITFASGGQQLIYVFATANTGDLVVNYWTGSGWYWRDQGLPPSPVGTTGVYYPAAITYASGGQQLIYVFAGASNASGPTSLVVNYWNGSNWYWADQGIPSNITWQCGPELPTYPFASSAVTFLALGSWVPEIYVFAEGGSYCGASGTPWLVLNYWNGIGWYWAVQGNM
jgi:hypothetical protein